MHDIAAIIDLACARGRLGVALTHQGGDKPYLATCLDRNGDGCDPRNWNTYPTPEEALADIHRRLMELPPCKN